MADDERPAAYRDASRVWLSSREKHLIARLVMADLQRPAQQARVSMGSNYELHTLLEKVTLL